MKKNIILICFAFLFLGLCGCVKIETVDTEGNNYPIISPFTGDYGSEIMFYFPAANSNKLDSEIRVIDNQNKSYEEIILDEILNGPENRELRNVFPDGLEILSVDVIGQIAYLNFNDKLVNSNLTEAEENLMIYSIVNTMVQSDKITRVQFLIDGDRSSFKNNSIQISEPLDPSNFLKTREFVSPNQFLKKYYSMLITRDELSGFYSDDYEELANSLESIDIQNIEIVDMSYNKYSTRLEVKINLSYENSNNEKFDLLQKIELIYTDHYEIKSIEEIK